jgi:hypothetical protein
VKAHEEVDLSFARAGFGDQSCRYGSWLQTEDGNKDNDDHDQGGGKTC